MTLLEDLEFRGLLYQNTDPEGLAARLQQGPVVLYNGFDPTADSLHHGSLVPILVLRRFQLAGHTPIALVGGGTGLIGDPSAKASERSLNDRETVAAWTDSIRAQLARFLEFGERGNGARLVDNHDWLGTLPAIELLRDIGKHFPVPYMLAKDSVAARLGSGISYTEFSYMILQAYDFLKLNETCGCELQTGGSDQWGNITAGADLIRRIAGRRVYGLTFPLITKGDGAKFGKTESGTVWLDANKTTPYQFYQFWINTDDQSVVAYLKSYTFLGRDDILALAEGVQRQPEKREAQQVLAREVTALVHGPAAARQAEKISRALFYGDVRELAADEIEQGLGEVPTWVLEEEGIGLVELLLRAGVCPSKRQAREDVQNGAIYLNGERCTALDATVRKADGLHGKYLVIRRGKSKYFLVK